MSPQRQPLALSTRGISSLLLAIFIFIGGYMLGSTFPETDRAVGAIGPSQSVVNRGSEGRVDFDLFWSAWDLLRARYVDQGDLDSQVLVYGAIKGMFAATDDPYTTFFDPEVNKAFNEELEGSFEGIGAEIGIRDNLLTIVSPLDDSPAERAGLRPGDKIINIDGTISADLTIEESVKLIRGDKGTEVILTIFREGEEETRDVSVIRDRIEIKSVVASEEEGVAVIRVSQFGKDTKNKLSEALRAQERSGQKKMIIDLRNNPGGILEVAIDTVGFFTEKGSVAVIEQSSAGALREKETKRSPIVSDDVEIVILINEGSASASEIFAAALKHHLPERVTLVGAKSFGKGSVQELIPMNGGTAAKITIAKWLTPGKNQIDGEGIVPDQEVEYTNEDFEADRDPQKQRALEMLTD